MTTRWRLYRHHEAGSILVIAMVSLALLTVIGMMAITTGNLESEISGNEKTYQEAFYSAELGIATGETIVEGLTTRAELQEGTLDGRFPEDILCFNAIEFKLGRLTTADSTCPYSDWKPLEWDKKDSKDSAKVDPIPTGLSRGAVESRYTIAAGWPEPDTDTIGWRYGMPAVYRFHVFARGTGSNRAARALLESIYAKRFD
jgi:Tfp pilus assembly protein PilX